MKKGVKIGLLLMVIMLLTGCSKNYMKEISYSEYQKLLEQKETFILEIMRTECPACIDFKPKITAVSKEYKIEIKYINTDHLSEKEEDELLQKVGIKGTPTVIFYHEGEEKTISSRITSSVSQDKIVSKFKAAGFIEE